MKDIIVKLNNKDILVIPTNIFNPIPATEILNDIKEMTSDEVRIIFDTILVRGNGKGRFVDCIFDGNKILKDTLKIKKLKKSDRIRDISTGILCQDKNIVNNSVLTSIQKRMILKGIAI